MCEDVGEKSYRRHVHLIQRFLKEESPQYGLVKKYDHILINEHMDIFTS